MISPKDALRLVLDATTELPPETRDLPEVAGLVLAESVCADMDQPPFDRAMMDGYAVPQGAAGTQLPVVELVAAGQASTVSLTEGECAEIMTGAPCPSGTWAVVPKEHVHLDENTVQFPPQIRERQNIAPRGSDRRQGDAILQPGDRLDPLAIAVLAKCWQDISPCCPACQSRDCHDRGRGCLTRQTARTRTDPRRKRPHALRHGPSHPGCTRCTRARDR